MSKNFDLKNKTEQFLFCLDQVQIQNQQMYSPKAENLSPTLEGTLCFLWWDERQRRRGVNLTTHLGQIVLNKNKRTFIVAKQSRKTNMARLRLCPVH